MMFRRSILAALLVGLIAGLVLSVGQVLSVTPIILEAETFEVPSAHEHGSEGHESEPWAPEDGTARAGYTIIANIFAGIGFAAILLALMSQLQLQGVTRLSPLKGMAWGLAGYVACFVAPGMGLPPEIPGIEAQPVEHRQTWWLFAVIAVGLGLLVVAFAPLKVKAAGIFSMALPYLVTIPHAAGPAFNHPDAETVATLTRLHQEFIVATGASNLAFWIVLGVMSGWVLNAWVLKGVDPDGNAGEPVSV